MPPNKEIIATVRQFAQGLLDDNGYEADLDNYNKFEAYIGDNGCVNYNVYLDGVDDGKVVKIAIEIKYDAKPEADKGHYVPDLIWQQLRVDDEVIIDELNAAYDRNRR
ncbi:predicted ORF [Xanthomonas phage XacN1]|nr:predicted ORF [Xanthomonas phage XacN1]